MEIEMPDELSKKPSEALPDTAQNQVESRGAIEAEVLKNWGFDAASSSAGHRNRSTGHTY